MGLLRCARNDRLLNVYLFESFTIVWGDVVFLSKKKSQGGPSHRNASALNRDIDTSKPVYYTSDDQFAVLLRLTLTQPFKPNV